MADDPSKSVPGRAGVRAGGRGRMWCVLGDVQEANMMGTW